MTRSPFTSTLSTRPDKPSSGGLLILDLHVLPIGEFVAYVDEFKQAPAGRGSRGFVNERRLGIGIDSSGLLVL